MTDAEPSSAGLLRLIYGYQVSQAIHVAAVLGIADELADGPRAVGDLASATVTHSGALHRLLRALAAVEVLREEPDGRYALTALGEALRERTVEEYAALLAAADYELVGETPTATDVSVIEARAI